MSPWFTVNSYFSSCPGNCDIATAFCWQESKILLCWRALLYSVVQGRLVRWIQAGSASTASRDSAQNTTVLSMQVENNEARDKQKCASAWLVSGKHLFFCLCVSVFSAHWAKHLFWVFWLFSSSVFGPAARAGARYWPGIKEHTCGG